jgi:hypothetical protein
MIRLFRPVYIYYLKRCFQFFFVFLSALAEFKAAVDAAVIDDLQSGRWIVIALYSGTILRRV